MGDQAPFYQVSKITNCIITQHWKTSAQPLGLISYSDTGTALCPFIYMMSAMPSYHKGRTAQLKQMAHPVKQK